MPVFQDAITYPCIIRIRKESPIGRFKSTRVNTLGFSDLSAYVQENAYEVNQRELKNKSWSLSDEKTQAILNKITAHGIPLEEYTDGKVFRGIITGLNNAFVIDVSTKDKLISDDPHSVELIKPFLLGRDVKKYETLHNSVYLIFIPKGWTREMSNGAHDAWGWFSRNFPAIANHLLPYANEAKKRLDKGEFWWELRACDYYAEFEKPKIIYPNICRKPEFTFNESNCYTNQKCFIIPIADKYLLGILNSNLCFFLFKNNLPKLGGDFYEPSYVYVRNFSIHKIDFSNHLEKEIHNKIVTLVETILELHKRLQTANNISEKELLESQIKTIDQQIDHLVYKLYGLTDSEIAFIEAKG